MSTLKEKMKLQQAEEMFSRGLITAAAYADIQVQCGVEQIVEDLTGDAVPKTPINPDQATVTTAPRPPATRRRNAVILQDPTDITVGTAVNPAGTGNV